MGFPGGSDSKESACNAGDLGSKPGTLHQKQAEKSETIKAREEINETDNNNTHTQK